MSLSKIVYRNSQGLHQDFKWKFVSRIDQNEGGSIAMSEIADWIRQKYHAEALKAVE